MQKLDKLLGRIAEGDNKAFEEMYLQTKDILYAVILSVLRNRHSAEDILQEAYIKIRTNACRYERGTSAKAWIITLGKNLAINEYNRRRQEVFVDFTENESLYGEYSIEEQFADNLALKTAFKVLGSDENEIVLMHTAGYKHREIAEALNIPLGTVTWKYGEAIKKMKEALSHER